MSCSELEPELIADLFDTVRQAADAAADGVLIDDWLARAECDVISHSERLTFTADLPTIDL